MNCMCCFVSRYVGGHSHAHFLDTHHCYTMELGANRVWDYVGDNFVHRLMQVNGLSS
jgi:BRCA1-associated protein